MRCHENAKLNFVAPHSPPPPAASSTAASLRVPAYEAHATDASGVGRELSLTERPRVHYSTVMLVYAMNLGRLRITNHIAHSAAASALECDFASTNSPFLRFHISPPCPPGRLPPSRVPATNEAAEARIEAAREVRYSSPLPAPCNLRDVQHAPPILTSLTPTAVAHRSPPLGVPSHLARQLSALSYYERQLVT